ncbi:YveK family protein [Paenibacillus mesophilus]|uniref:YveK family protein n=1 Tax=Paenibacillus mesophilus TaxID=2582849 RepID=UPI0013053899|nr:Wzz/FepE/Etk N-terminal domain-containing protein [Paenibacillus mesophilus]
MDPGLKGYLAVLQKRFWMLALLVCFSCTIAGIYSYYFVKPVYSAKVKLIVNKANEVQGIGKVLDFGSVNSSMMLVNTYKEIIKSSAIMGKAVEAHPEFDLDAEQLSRKVKVEVVTNTQVLTLTVMDYSHERAVRMVNSIAEAFGKEIISIMGVDNVTILDRSNIGNNTTPVNTNPKLNIAAAFIVSTLLSVALAFVIEHFDETIRTESDLSALLEIPLLAAVPRIKRKDTNSRQFNSVSKSRKAGEASYVGINQ